MEKVKISKVVIKIREKELELSLQEVSELKAELDKLLGESFYPYYIYYPSMTHIFPPNPNWTITCDNTAHTLFKHNKRGIL